jgi:predicted RNA binding protein YcfA (HicA-like mRNA interferase family)
VLAVIEHATRRTVHQGRDVAKGTLRGILSDTSMTVEDLERLL